MNKINKKELNLNKDISHKVKREKKQKFDTINIFRNNMYNKTKNTKKIEKLRENKNMQK